MNQPSFQLLSDFFVHLTVLPHSSAAVERVFSQVNCIKNKKTNRLTVTSVRNKLLAKQAVSRQGFNCTTWQPSASLVKDVVDGTCSQRYTQRMQQQRDENTVTVTVFDPETEDPPLPHLH